MNGNDKQVDALHLERAGAQELDALGYFVGVVRNSGESDEQFRSRVRAAQPAAAPVDLSNWAAHYSINPAAVEALQAMLASTPAAPGIDLTGWQFERPSGTGVIVVSAPNGKTWIAEPDDRLHMLAAAVIDASPKGGSDARYFSADPALGEFTTHDTLQAAIDSAESMLSDAGDDAHESGWTDDPPQICYGVVLGECVEVEGSRKLAPEGSEFAEHVEFKLQATSAEVGA